MLPFLCLDADMERKGLLLITAGPIIIPPMIVLSVAELSPSFGADDIFSDISLELA